MASFGLRTAFNSLRPRLSRRVYSTSKHAAQFSFARVSPCTFVWIKRRAGRKINLEKLGQKMWSRPTSSKNRLGPVSKRPGLLSVFSIDSQGVSESSKNQNQKFGRQNGLTCLREPETNLNSPASQKKKKKKKKTKQNWREAAPSATTQPERNLNFVNPLEQAFSLASTNFGNPKFSLASQRAGNFEISKFYEPISGACKNGVSTPLSISTYFPTPFLTGSTDSHTLGYMKGGERLDKSSERMRANNFGHFGWKSRTRPNTRSCLVEHRSYPFTSSLTLWMGVR